MAASGSVARPRGSPAAAPAAQLLGLREQIEDHLETLWRSSSAPAQLLEGLRYGLLGGGKRLRAILVLATADALGHEPAQVLPIAAAIEMIHSYTLIHDDLPAMDDAPMRRGKPSCHRRYGEGLAILIGDTLFAEAIGILVRDQQGGPERVLAALGPMLEFAGVEGLAGGQFLDLTSAARTRPALLGHTARLKTASLFRAAVLSVAGWASATAAIAAALDRYACALGELFQLRDDELDAHGDAATLGKEPGCDARNGRYTYLDAAAEQPLHLLGRGDELAADARQALLPLGHQPLLLTIAELIAKRTQ